MTRGKALPIVTIKKRSDFLSASSRGRKFITGTFILQEMTRPDTHPAGQVTPRYGFTVTKKMGNAVARNRIKRRLREALRAVAPRHAQPGRDYVVISRHKIIDCPFPDLLRDMEFAFSRIIYIKDTPNPKP